MDVRALVLFPCKYLNIIDIFRTVAQKKSTLRERANTLLAVHVVAREHVELDFLGPIFEPPFPIGHPPQAREQQPVFERQFDQLLVFKETGLDATCTHNCTCSHGACMVLVWCSHRTFSDSIPFPTPLPWHSARCFQVKGGI
jgi:hypothetical protein